MGIYLNLLTKKFDKNETYVNDKYFKKKKQILQILAYQKFHNENYIQS